MLGNHASKCDDPLQEYACLGLDLCVMCGKGYVVGPHGGLGRDRVGDNGGELVDGGLAGIRGFTSIKCTREDIGLEELAFLCIVMWQGLDLVGFGYGVVESVCECGANVAIGEVEVCAEVAKVADHLEGGVDVVPKEVT